MTERGFSLLEMVVAMALLGVTLGAIYQAASGATRNVRADERYAYAVELGRSLLAEHSRVPIGGFEQSDVTAGGFSWQVRSLPLSLDRGGLAPGVLQQITVTVGWADGIRDREIQLDSVVESLPASEGL